MKKGKTELSACYWCGAPSTSMDHVPPRGFYRAGSDYRPIKVPSCSAHNSQLSKIDERFRLYIQASSASEVAAELFRDATLRGLLREQSRGFWESIKAAMHPAKLNGERTIAMGIDFHAMQTFFEKIGRGLLFHHTGIRFRGSVRSECSLFVKEGGSQQAAVEVMIALRPLLTPGETTQMGIFDYRYAYVREPQGDAFAVQGQFYGDVSFIVLGTPDVTRDN